MINSLKFPKWSIGMKTFIRVQLYRLRKGHQETGKLGSTIVYNVH